MTGTVDVYTRAGADAVVQEAVSAQAVETTQVLEALTARVQALEAVAAGTGPIAVGAVPRVVVFGSSNAAPAAGWDGDLARAMGATGRMHNYAIGGGGFTSTPDNRFSTQVSNAVEGMAPMIRAEVSHVLVVDMLNDIRAQNPVEDAAGPVFRAIREAFPTARIILVPVLFNESRLNSYAQMMYSCQARTNEAARAGLAYGVEVVWGSWTWFRCGPAEAAVTDEPGGIHFTQAGYARVVHYLSQYLRGAPTDRNYGWAWPVHTNGYSLDPDRNYLLSKREGSTCFLLGSFVTRREVGTDWDLMTLPPFMTAFTNTQVVCFDSNRRIRGLYVAPNGVLYSNEGLPAGTQILVNACYPQF